MNLDELIPLDHLCTHYQVEMSFFIHLNEFGLIEIQSFEESHYVHYERIDELEKIIRLHQDLNLNFEGIDTVFNLLNRIDKLEEELIETKNRLRIYED